MSLLPIKILEYENGRVQAGLNTHLIKELKAIIDKYGDNAEPYLAYVYLMTALDSPFANLPDHEKSDSVIFEIHGTLGDIDPFEPLLTPAVEKINSLMDSPLVLLAKELEQELNRFRNYLKYTPLQDGEGGNFKDRMSLMEKIEKISASYAKVKKQADEELKIKLRGNAELGDY